MVGNSPALSVSRRALPVGRGEGGVRSKINDNLQRSKRICSSTRQSPCSYETQKCRAVDEGCFVDHSKRPIMMTHLSDLFPRGAFFRAALPERTEIKCFRRVAAQHHDLVDTDSQPFQAPLFLLLQTNNKLWQLSGSLGFDGQCKE